MSVPASDAALLPDTSLWLLCILPCLRCCALVRVASVLLTLQGDAERKRGLPISALCDRGKVEVPKSQLAFLTYVVKPTFEALKGLAPVTAGYALDNIDKAVQHWEQQVGS